MRRSRKRRGVRRVRTREGAERYGVPIGSIIPPAARQENRPTGPLDMDEVLREEEFPEDHWAAALDGEYGHGGLRFAVQSAYTHFPDRANGSFGSGGFHGLIFDRSGKPVGTVHQQYHRDMRGNLHVKNDVIEVGKENGEVKADDPSVRGTGFGSEFYGRLEGIYERNGVASVSVHAAEEDGGYVWAMSGYDWDPDRLGKSVKNVRDRLGRTYDNLPADDPDRALLDDMRDRIAEDRAWSEDFPMPVDIAELSTPTRPNLGREIMAGSSWYGVLPLREVDLSPMREYPNLADPEFTDYDTRTEFERGFDGVYPGGHTVEISEAEYDVDYNDAHRMQGAEFVAEIRDPEGNFTNQMRVTIHGTKPGQMRADIEFDEPGDSTPGSHETVDQLREMVDEWINGDPEDSTTPDAVEIGDPAGEGEFPGLRKTYRGGTVEKASKAALTELNKAAVDMFLVNNYRVFKGDPTVFGDQQQSMDDYDWVAIHNETMNQRINSWFAHNDIVDPTDGLELWANDAQSTQIDQMMWNIMQSHPAQPRSEPEGLWIPPSQVRDLKGADYVRAQMDLSAAIDKIVGDFPHDLHHSEFFPDLFRWSNRKGLNYRRALDPNVTDTEIAALRAELFRWMETDPD